MVQGIDPLTLGLAAGSLAVSAAGVWVTIRMANKVGVIDVPNERSSHSVPTPRMGGIAMVAAAVLSFTGWVFLAAGGTSFSGLVWTVPLFALVMSGLGLWDDLGGLSPLFRFAAQIACSAGLLLAMAMKFPSFQFEGYPIPPVVWVPVGAIWVVWMLNLYNFMDGIDGLAGGEASLAASFFFLVFVSFGQTGWAAANLFVAAAAMGFLVHNWPPAKVFMGDAGSVFLGAFFGMQTVAAALTTPVPFVVLALPFSNFILDTTVTLLRRIWRGEKWYISHRSHYYQRMTDLGMTHNRVTVIELLFAAGSCIASAVYLSVSLTGRAISIAVILSACVAMGIFIGRKEREKPGVGTDTP